MLYALDPATALAGVISSNALNGLIWAMLAILRPQLKGPVWVAAGSFLSAVGFVRLIMRPPAPSALYLTIDNVLIISSLLWLTVGYLRLMDRPVNVKLIVTCTLATVIGLTLGYGTTAEDTAIRIHLTTVVAFILIFFSCHTVIRHTDLSMLIRAAVVVIMAIHGIVALMRSLAQLTRSALPSQVLADRLQAWIFLEWSLFFSMLNLIMLLTVVMKFSNSLQTSVTELNAEVAERRKLQHQLARQLEAERALREEQYQFVRMVTHELRTPLAVIDRAAEMVRELVDRPSEAVTQRLAKIHEATRGLFNLIDRFLITERDQKIEPQFEIVTVSTLAERLRRHFEGTASVGRIRITLAEGLPPLRADGTMLTTVLVNLVDNALKYSPETASVAVEASLDNDMVLIAVLDQGIGIPQEEFSQIGQRFYRGSNTYDTVGAGIGLYSARKLLDCNGGSLMLGPRHGGGTVASLRLPFIADMPAVAMEGV